MEAPTQPCVEPGSSPCPGRLSILQRPSLRQDSSPCAASTSTRALVPGRFASPPITLQRRRNCHASSQPWTLGAFLSAATKQLDAVLPSPGKRQRPALNFGPRRGRSAAADTKATAPCASDRRAVVQILRTLGIVGVNQQITATEMKAYDDMFAMPLGLPVLQAMAALVDRAIPADMAPSAGDVMVRAR